MSLVMSEQQKIDETVESITNKDKKKNTKIVQSSTAFEEEQRFVAENEIDDQDGILDTKQWESKKMKYKINCIYSYYKSKYFYELVLRKYKIIFC